MFAPKVAKPQTMVPGRSVSSLARQRSTVPARAHSGAAAQQIDSASRTSQGANVSWDFSRIPLFSAERDAGSRESGLDFLSRDRSDAGKAVPHRTSMESAFGEDFSTVRVLTGRRSALDPFGAEAVASGETIAFAADRPSKQVVGHELAHVVQQRRHGPPAGARSPDRSAPSERDAQRAGLAAARGSPAAVSSAPGGAFAFSPKNPFDDPKAWASAAGAAAAMKAYQALARADRQAAVAASYKKDLVRVLGSLSAGDQVHTFVDPLREIALWVEQEETRASSGMTDEQIAGEQAKFLIKQAADAAKAAADAAAKAKGIKAAPPTAAQIEQARKDAVAATSIPKSKGGWWAPLSPAEKANWITRGNAAIAAVVKYAAAKHPELAVTAASFKLDFPAIEARGATVIAAGNPAQVGRAFVISAELNPAYVMDIVVHEVFGHPEYGTYGTEYQFGLYDKAAAKIPGYVKPAAGSGERETELDAYAYQETEIYAILRSMAYRTNPTKADAPKVPNLDTQGLIDWHVGFMKQQWSPTVIVAILRGLRRRLVIDPRISAAALKVFDSAVDKNFGAKMRVTIAAP